MTRPTSIYALKEKHTGTIKMQIISKEGAYIPG